MLDKDRFITGHGAASGRSERVFVDDLHALGHQANRETVGILTAHEAHVATGDAPEQLLAALAKGAIGGKDILLRQLGLLVVRKQQIQEKNNLLVRVVHGGGGQQHELEAAAVFQDLLDKGGHGLSFGHVLLHLFPAGLDGLVGIDVRLTLLGPL